MRKSNIDRGTASGSTKITKRCDLYHAATGFNLADQTGFGNSAVQDGRDLIR